jgi:hypothetical protein
VRTRVTHEHAHKPLSCIHTRTRTRTCTDTHTDTHRQTDRQIPITHTGTCIPVHTQ